MILVTGATGNVGSDLVHQLSLAGHSVRALVRGEKESGLPANVQVAQGDLNQPESLALALKDVRGVFLLGGYRDMPGLLAQICSAGIAHVVLLSSRSVVDETGECYRPHVDGIGGGGPLLRDSLDHPTAERIHVECASMAATASRR